MTLGTLQHGRELERRAETKTGLEYVGARLYALNFSYCHCRGEEGKRLWGIVNRLMWRFKAMFQGGDCELADLDGAVPHDRLWTIGMELSKNNRGRYIRKG